MPAFGRAAFATAPFAGTSLSFVIPVPVGNIFKAGSTQTHLVRKTPADVESYMIDWTDELQGDPIMTSTWACIPADLFETSSFDGQKATVRVTGGTIGNEYVMTNTVTTYSGVVREHSLRLFIEEYDFL